MNASDRFAERVRLHQVAAGQLQYVRADDTPVELVLTGRFAALYKELIVRGALAAQRHPATARYARPLVAEAVALAGSGVRRQNGMAAAARSNPPMPATANAHSTPR